MGPTGRVWLAAAGIFLAATRVAAQDPSQIAAFERTMEEVRKSHFEGTGGRTLSEFGRLRYGAYTTASWLGTDNEFGSTRKLTQFDGKFWVHGQVRGHTVYGRVRLRYQDFGTGDSFTGGGDGLTYPIGDRYWYRYDWRTDERAEEGRDPGWNWWVQVGRQYVNWVSGMVLSDTLYALRVGAEAGGFKISGLLAWTPDSFIDFDGSRPGYSTDTDRMFWGIVVEYKKLHNHRPYLYFLGQEDNNDTVLTGGLRYGYDSRYVAIGSTGQIITGSWLYRVEFIYEFGTSVSDLVGTFPQTLEDIEAWAGRFFLAWMPHPQRRTKGLRFEFEVLLGSADSDRSHSSQAIGGNTSGTDDQAFNAFGYVNTGLALAPELSNLISIRLSASKVPLRGRGVFDKMRVQIDAFGFFKLDDNAPMSVLTIPGEGYVGFEVDLTLVWVLTSDVAIQFNYGIFIPGAGVPGSDPRHFGYVAFSYGF